MPDSIRLPWGYVSFGNDEVTLVNNTADHVDCPKFRLATRVGNALGAVSWSHLRDDGNLEEVALLQGKIDERWPKELAGELVLHLRNRGSGDTAMVPVAQVRHDGIQLFVPISAPNLGAGGNTQNLVDSTGRYWLRVQEDGNLVLYDTKDAKFLAIWSTGTFRT